MKVLPMQPHQTAGTMRPRSPDLANVCEDAWQRCGLVAYRFSRQVRHDVGNHQTAIRMLDLLDQMPGSKASQLPEEFVGPAVLGRVRDAAWSIAMMTHQLVFLANAPNRAAYAPTSRVRIGDLFDHAVATHLPDGGINLAQVLGPVASGRVVQMGDMLEVALANYYFQWLPTGGQEQADQLVDARMVDQAIQLDFQATQVRAIQHVCRCHDGQTSGQCCLDTPGDCKAVDLALCLSAHIIAVHGGSVRQIDEADRSCVRVMLPRARDGG